MGRVGVGVGLVVVIVFRLPWLRCFDERGRWVRGGEIQVWWSRGSQLCFRTVLIVVAVLRPRI